MYPGVAQFKTSVVTWYSEYVKDSFEIFLTIPEDYSPAKKYDLFIYGDAKLISGKELRKQVESSPTLSKQGNYIFAGIGYTHRDHRMRNRDFILPKISHGDTLSGNSKGRCREFYQFLVKELIPGIEKKYGGSGTRSIMGHSLGGLFVFYCLFQNENVFSNYFALSPALWVNHNGIYRFNKISSALKRQSTLYFSAGSKEDFNLILTGGKKMNAFLQVKNYGKLDFEYEVHKGRGHFSQVSQSVRKILGLITGGEHISQVQGLQ